MSAVTHWRKAMTKVSSDLGRKIEYFLATGNLVSNTGLDLQQVSGYAIVGEKLNFLRYLSHFRSVHRGAFFAEIRTTTVRKLLPDSWGKHSFPAAHAQTRAPSLKVAVSIQRRLHVPGAHARRRALRPAEPPHARVPDRHGHPGHVRPARAPGLAR